MTPIIGVVAVVASAIAGMAVVLRNIEDIRTIAARLFSTLRRSRKTEETFRIERLADPHDERVLDALSLYKDSLPDDERDPPENIMRWLWEVDEETKHGTCKLKDYFAVGILDSRVCGLAYFHYYPSAGLAFISYIVTKRRAPEVTKLKVSGRLLDWAYARIRKECKQCHGVVAEVDDPNYLSSNEGRNHARARIRQFRILAEARGFALKVLRMPYVQPKVSLDESTAAEHPMLILYARLGKEKIRHHIPRSEAERVVQFVYGNIYGDHFDTDEVDDQRYRDYLGELQQRVIGQLPELVEAE